ncbi:hypothetical protein B0H13DRAFT_1965389 [Mycena leptocephala]|nr:hypothetical protein B0H13DRAFT_2049972 [Mycena leptocephala]KAJ7929047.1 hypothetical protein B0H13DRAFT_1965389 [Mycena leptocephala]
MPLGNARQTPAIASHLVGFRLIVVLPYQPAHAVPICVHVNHHLLPLLDHSCGLSVHSCCRVQLVPIRMKKKFPRRQRASRQIRPVLHNARLRFPTIRVKRWRCQTHRRASWMIVMTLNTRQRRSTRKKWPPMSQLRHLVQIVSW